jgi:hypothetical protein
MLKINGVRISHKTLHVKECPFGRVHPYKVSKNKWKIVGFANEFKTLKEVRETVKVWAKEGVWK